MRRKKQIVKFLSVVLVIVLIASMMTSITGASRSNPKVKQEEGIKEVKQKKLEQKPKKSSTREQSITSLETSSPWPITGHGKRRTGRTTVSSGHVDGTEKWNITDASVEFENGPVIDENDNLYLHSRSALASYTSDGTGRFAIEYPDGSDNFTSAPTVGSDYLYISQENKIVARNKIDGTEAWNVTLDEDEALLTDSPLETPNIDGELLFVCDENKTYAVNTTSESLKWSNASSPSREASPAIGSDGTVYVPSDNGNLYAYYPENGTEKWNYSASADPLKNPTVADDGTIYIAGNKNMHAINPNGTGNWTFETGGYITSSPSIASDGTIVFGSYDENIYAVYPNGTERWNQSTSASVTSSPAISGDNIVHMGAYFSYYGYRFLAFSLDGTGTWNFKTNSYPGGKPAIDSSGNLNFVTNDGSFYKIGSSDAYTLTVEEPEGLGNVSVNGTQIDTYPDESEYSNGTEVILEAEPDPNWAFSHWEGNISSAKEDSSYITVNMSKNRTLKAVFVSELRSLTIYEPEGNGNVSVDGTEITSYPYNEEIPLCQGVDIEPKADDGWYFSHWYIDSNNISQERKKTLVMNYSHEVRPYFISFRDENPKDASTGVDVEMTGGPVYEISTTLSVLTEFSVSSLMLDSTLDVSFYEVNAKGNRTFIGENTSVSSGTNLGQSWSDKGDTNPFNTPLGETYYWIVEGEFTFAGEDLSVQSMVWNFTVEEPNVLSTSLGNQEAGWIERSPYGYEYENGSHVDLKIHLNPGWNLISWGPGNNFDTSDDIVSGSLTSEELTIEMNDDFYFEVETNESELGNRTLTLRINGGGQVANTPSGHNNIYEIGMQVTLDAIPDDGWEFSHWSRDLISTSKNETIYMDTDKWVTAHFTEIEKPTATTLSATNITDTSATLNMEYTLGSMDNGTVYFQYKKEDDERWTEAGGKNVSNDGEYSYNVNISDLGDEDYEYRAVVEYGENETVYGETKDIEEPWWHWLIPFIIILLILAVIYAVYRAFREAEDIGEDTI